MLEVVQSVPDDLPLVTDIDLKTFDYPWNTNQWKHHYRTGVVFLGFNGKDHAGIATMRTWREGCAIMKWGVKPGHRCLGLGSLLLEHCIDYANQDEDIHKIVILIPESDVYPATELRPDGQNLGEYLKSKNFKAELPIVANKFKRGAQREHGIRFVLDLEEQLCASIPVL